MDGDWRLITQYEFDNALDDSLEGETVWFILGYISLIVYVVVFMGDVFHPVRSRLSLGWNALVTVGLAILACFGLASLFGLFFGPVHQALPILLFGLGADDMFVITRTHDSLKRKDPLFASRPLVERVALTMASAGTAILITTLTNAFVFFISAITPIPALRSFCIWAGIGILLLFVFSTTYFVALFSLDLRRQDCRRIDAIPCIKSKWEKDENLFGIRDGALGRFLRDSYGRFLMADIVRPIVLVASVVLFSIMCWGASRTDVQFKYSDWYCSCTLPSL